MPHPRAVRGDDGRGAGDPPGERERGGPPFVLVQKHGHPNEGEKRQHSHEDHFRGKPDDLNGPWPEAPRVAARRLERADQAVPLSERARLEPCQGHGPRTGCRCTGLRFAHGNL